MMKLRRWINCLRGRDLATRVQVSVPISLLGSEYGGYCLCCDRMGADSIVYSFGIGEDISFDLAVIQRFGSQVHAFDPTPRAIKFVESQSLPESFHLHPFGLADSDGTATFYPPVKQAHVSHSVLPRSRTADRAIEVQLFRLGTIMKKLDHDRIDVLKMDIEGAEYDVIDDILHSGVEISQVLIEFHHHLEGVELARTQRAIERLNHAGYRIFHISPTGHEYSFILGDAE